MITISQNEPKKIWWNEAEKILTTRFALPQLTFQTVSRPFAGGASSLSSLGSEGSRLVYT